MNDIILNNAIILSNISESMSIKEAYDAINSMVNAFKLSK